MALKQSNPDQFNRKIYNISAVGETTEFSKKNCTELYTQIFQRLLGY